MANIAVGDVVFLNSGSPKLTVTEVNENDSVDVTWIDGTGDVNEATFPGACVSTDPKLEHNVPEKDTPAIHKDF